jgi:hypothetical protein
VQLSIVTVDSYNFQIVKFKNRFVIFCLKVHKQSSKFVTIYFVLSTIFLLLVSRSSDHLIFAQVGSVGNHQQPTSFQLFRDLQGTFSIVYPVGWKVIPIAQTEKQVAVLFSSSNANKSEDFMVHIQDIPTVAQKLTFTRDNIGTYLYSLTGSFHKFFSNYIIYDINLTISRIDGHPAITTLASRSVGNLDTGDNMMHVSSLINGKMYQLIYTASFTEYNRHLPLAQHMVDSLKILRP